MVGEGEGAFRLWGSSPPCNLLQAQQTIWQPGSRHRAELPSAQKQLEKEPEILLAFLPTKPIKLQGWPMLGGPGKDPNRIFTWEAL